MPQLRPEGAPEKAVPNGASRALYSERSWTWTLRPGKIPAGKRSSWTLEGIAVQESSRSISLLTIEKLKNMFLSFNVLKSFACPKYIVTPFPADCLGMTSCVDEYLKYDIDLLTFETCDTVSFRGVTSRNEIIFWLVDRPDKITIVQTTWAEIRKSNPTVSTYLTVVRAQRKVSQGSMVAYIPVGCEAIDMRSGKSCKLSHRLQICRMTAPLESLSVESFGPEGQTLAFHATIQGCSAIVLFDTGATHSFVSNRFVSQNNIPFRAVRETALVADGRELEILGSVLIRLAFGSFAVNHTFRITNLGYQFDAVLGMDWLSKYKCMLDCANHTCTIRKGSVSHTFR